MCGAGSPRRHATRLGHRHAIACPTLVRDGTQEAERLGEAIAELAARLHTATYELLVRLREFDERASWNCGFLSCAHWLHWRTGIDLGAARERVRVAKTLKLLPLVSVAMQRGAISCAKVRALTRVATQESERVLPDFASGSTSDAPKQKSEPRLVDGGLEVADGAIHTSADMSRRLACDASPGGEKVGQVMKVESGRWAGWKGRDAAPPAAGRAARLGCVAVSK